MRSSVRGYYEFTVNCHFPHKSDTNSSRLFRGMFEAVMPIWVFESEREHGVASKGQAVIAGFLTDYAVPRRVSTSSRASQ